MIKRRLPIFIAIGWLAFIVALQIKDAYETYFDIQRLFEDRALLAYVVLGGVMVCGLYLEKRWAWWYSLICATISLATLVRLFWPLDVFGLFSLSLLFPILMIASLLVQKISSKRQRKRLFS